LHFKGKGLRYEIWNEPGNIHPFNQESQYAALCHKVADVVHSVDPSALISNGGLGRFDFEWANNMFATGVGNIDAVAVHEYTMNGFYGPGCNTKPELVFPNMEKWRAIYQQYLPQVKTDWMTEWGPDLASDCNFDQHKYAYIIVRQMLANWMVGITMQVIYADGDYGYSLFAADDDFKGSHLRRANLALEKLTTITGQKPIQSYTNPTTNSGIWSVTLTGSPTTQITWVPKGSAKVTVPQGSTCMDLYGDNVALSTQGITESVTMDESAGVYYFTLAN
jgi:hypothetical protein